MRCSRGTNAVCPLLPVNSRETISATHAVRWLEAWGTGPIAKILTDGIILFNTVKTQMRSI